MIAAKQVSVCGAAGGTDRGRRDRVNGVSHRRTIDISARRVEVEIVYAHGFWHGKIQRVGQHHHVGLFNLLRGIALMLKIDIESSIDRHRLDETRAYRRPGFRHGLAKDSRGFNRRLQFERGGGVGISIVVGIRGIFVGRLYLVDRVSAG